MSEGKVGRPLKYQSAEELQEAIDKYFESCWADVPVIGAFGPVMIDDLEQEPEEKIDKKTGKKKFVYPKKLLTEHKQVRPYTITGLALAVGLDRHGLLDYSGKDEFSHTIKHAKLKVEQFAEEQLFLMKNAGGAMFNLKNNYGWRDKSEQVLSGPNGGPVQTEVRSVICWEDESVGNSAAGNQEDSNSIPAAIPADNNSSKPGKA